MATMARTVAARASGRRRERIMRTVGWVLTVGVGLFLAFDAVVHASRIPAVMQSFHQVGFPAGAVLPLSIIEACCLVLYLVPRTKVLGAILLTGDLGGAVALQVLSGVPLFATLGPVYVAAVAWLALYLRDGRLRAVLPPLAR